MGHENQPSDMSEAVMHEMCALEEVITSNPEVLAIRERIAQKGFTALIAIATVKNGENQLEPTPKVRDGQICPGTFSTEDKKVLRRLKIKL